MVADSVAYVMGAWPPDAKRALRIYCFVYGLEARGLKRPAATSYGHRDGRQSGLRDGVDHRHERPSSRRAIAAPN